MALDPEASCESHMHFDIDGQNNEPEEEQHPGAKLKMPSEILGCNYDPSAEPENLSEFGFETDHEALRSNPDYLSLLRALAVLQAQKIQAVRDLDRLAKARDEALKDPIEFVKRLQKGEDLQLPRAQKLGDVPADIAWEKYSLAPNSTFLKPETRNKNGAVTLPCEKQQDPSRELLDGFGFKVEKTSNGRILVRGRIFDENKPKTFNQPWTAEEQKRLEELLIEFPSEDVEMERWKKVAAALGNRTAVQVQSRVQKYFLKLQKAGLPIPSQRVTKVGKNRNYKPTTPCATILSREKRSSFFPSLAPDVKMTDDEDAFESGSTSSSSEWNVVSASRFAVRNDGYYLEEQDVSDEDGVDESQRQSAEYSELMWLKRIRREKELLLRGHEPAAHEGFRCDGCGCAPIAGGHFQCADCLRISRETGGVDTVDFCCECAPKGLDLPPLHTRQHVLRPMRKRHWNADYSSRRNYLDPNFVK